MKHFRIWCALLLMACSGVQATGQTLSDAAASYNNFVRFLNNDAKNAAYAELHKSYTAYAQFVATASKQAELTQAKSTLKDMLPFLAQAASYYSSQGNPEQTLQFVQDYVDIALMPAMQAEQLSLISSYTDFTKLAAFNTWNRKDYEKAVPYLQAYLETGDTERREDAYHCLGKYYYNQRQYAQAKHYLKAGLQQYPSSLAMLTVMINASTASGDDADLQPYLTQALALRPNDEGLLNIQGLLYEKTQQFEQAIDIYQRLRQQKPQALAVARHLALNHYNAGIKYQQMAEDKTYKKQAKSLEQQARSHFEQAEPLMSQIILSDPSRKALTYAVALANIYSITGAEDKLQEANQRLQQWGYGEVTRADLALLDMNEAATPPAPKPQAQPATPQPTAPQTPVPTPVPVARQQSDVDIQIPVNPTTNQKTFAVIISNEEYSKVPKVPMANHDGQVFAEYCNKVLGLPEENIRQHYNVTNLEMEDAVDDIKAIAAACGGQLNILFYYSGHGMPDDDTKDAYLLPIDANGMRTRGCMPLHTLYDDLAATGAENICVFIDACFSGGTRDGHALNPAARSVAIRPKPTQAKGNMVIFTATSEKETAMPYEEKQHGLFTYFLLKKLKESRGKTTLGELDAYIRENVALKAQLINKKPQTPTVTSSAAMSDRWKGLRLTD